jgi:hypothetical protein
MGIFLHSGGEWMGRRLLLLPSLRVLKYGTTTKHFECLGTF